MAKVSTLNLWHIQKTHCQTLLHLSRLLHLLLHLEGNVFLYEVLTC